METREQLIMGAVAEARHWSSLDDLSAAFEDPALRSLLLPQTSLAAGEFAVEWQQSPS